MGHIIITDAEELEVRTRNLSDDEREEIAIAFKSIRTSGSSDETSIIKTVTGDLYVENLTEAEKETLNKYGLLVSSSEEDIAS